MQGEKIEQVREAATKFLENMPTQNRVGLITFNNQRLFVSEPGLVEEVSGTLRSAIDNMYANGGTALYDTLIYAINSMTATEPAEGEDRIRAIVLLSDGQDTTSESGLNDVIQRINEAHTGRNPLLIIPVAYGSDADIATLNSIARASATKVQSGNPDDILKLLEIISSYF
jgi:Ca-activated chloride channel family protein